MGMAASQARLLMLTARIHDTEYQAQMIQSAKLQLATQEDEVYRKYNEALDATTLTFTNDNKEIIPATFNNLCGTGSINNGMYGKNFVFRSGDDDKLIVPDDIYEGYQDFTGDAYEFAMYMMGIDPNDLTEAENSYVKDLTNDGENPDPTLSGLQEEMKKLLSELEETTGMEGLAADIEGGETIQLNKNDSNYAKAKEIADAYTAKRQEYKHKLYKKGAESIYKNAGGGNGAEFDQSKFNYYQRWGKLIENEVDIKYCVKASDYSPEFSSDGETLQQMLQSGRIVVDEVKIGSDGTLSDKTTSVATDDSLNYTTTSTIDKTAVAKAEAEYEYAMKKIDKKDKQYDMELNKLETERTALTKEYDSVKKVVQDNIERTFGIFS